MSHYHKLISELIAEANEDEVGLWFIVSLLRNEYGIVDQAHLRSTTLDLVQELLESGRVAAGYYDIHGEGIITWDMPTASAISRIAKDWDNLGREPNIGEIVVLIGKSQKSP